MRYGDGGEPVDLVPDSFAAEVLRLSERGFDGAPEGPVVVEYVGADGRVEWQAYHQEYAGLLPLAEELLRQP